MEIVEALLKGTSALQGICALSPPCIYRKPARAPASPAAPAGLTVCHSHEHTTGQRLVQLFLQGRHLGGTQALAGAAHSAGMRLHRGAMARGCGGQPLSGMARIPFKKAPGISLVGGSQVLPAYDLTSNALQHQSFGGFTKDIKAFERVQTMLKLILSHSGGYPNKLADVLFGAWLAIECAQSLYDMRDSGLIRDKINRRQALDAILGMPLLQHRRDQAGPTPGFGHYGVSVAAGEHFLRAPVGNAVSGPWPESHLVTGKPLGRARPYEVIKTIRGNETNDLDILFISPQSSDPLFRLFHEFRHEGGNSREEMLAISPPAEVFS